MIFLAALKSSPKFLVQTPARRFFILLALLAAAYVEWSLQPPVWQSEGGGIFATEPLGPYEPRQRIMYGIFLVEQDQPYYHDFQNICLTDTPRPEVIHRYRSAFLCNFGDHDSTQWLSDQQNFDQLFEQGAHDALLQNVETILTIIFAPVLAAIATICLGLGLEALAAWIIRGKFRT